MKKLTVLTALAAIITTFAPADNLENLNFKSGYGMGNIDDQSLEYSQFMNELSGTLSLDDEMKGLKFNFDIERYDFLDQNDDFGGAAWNTDFNLMKSKEIGNKELDFILGFKYGNSDNLKIGYLDGLVPVKQPDGHGYEAYFGTVIAFTLFGQNGSVTPRIVYYNDSDLYTRDYKDQGTAGWGGDFDIAVGGPIVKGKYGGINYKISLDNHWRKATDTKDTPSNGENSVYLNYIGVLSYNSPKFYGFGFDLNVFNQWEKFTGDNQRNNGFYVQPKLSYTSTFDTSIGELTINPYISYNVVDDQTRHVNYVDNKYDYEGNNELAGGIEFSLNRE